jgi:hypothetical protein
MVYKIQKIYFEGGGGGGGMMSTSLAKELDGGFVFFTDSISSAVHEVKVESKTMMARG